MATEPMLAGAAAWIMLHPRREPLSPVSTSDRLLAVGFVLYGCVEFFDASSRARQGFGWINRIAWIAVGLPLATTRIAVHLDRFGRKARRDEDTARTNEYRLRALADSNTEFLAERDELGLLTHASQGAISAAGAAGQTLVGRKIARNGIRVPVLIAGAQITQDSVVLIAIDLSVRKQAERDLALHQRELEETLAVLRNAIESRPHEAHVSIRLARRDKWATIEITDDGRGIPPEHRDRLFESFFSTRTREGGTGLGLSWPMGSSRTTTARSASSRSSAREPVSS